MDLRLETFLPYRLNRAAAMSSRQCSHIYRHEFGLTVPEWRVLATLGHRGTASATGIGRDSAMHKTKVSRAVASLPPRRWVARESDEADRRLAHLPLTPTGRAACARPDPPQSAFAGAPRRRTPPPEQSQLPTGLTTTARALG